ncbi:hypothetical protein [Spiroplasma poulsonii]|uniref:hypothetical protein n=1 Tax=Spiroplasma poulsonii TaxID=2138 RepID=UPI001F4CB5E6|nr:hypothetical protein [Spiroplasma poulsonii]UNF62071.1 hypothetical protein MNU24_00985 [Spiroplasma poulsonii]
MHTETPIQRPKSTKTILFLVKRKHTIKTQVLSNKKLQKLLQQVSLEKHMIMLYLKNSKIPILKNTKLIAYIKEYKNHNNVLIPTRKQRKPLNKEQKQYNRLVSKWELLLKIFFAILKNLKLLQKKYRNRRKRFWF